MNDILYVAYLILGVLIVCLLVILVMALFRIQKENQDIRSQIKEENSRNEKIIQDMRIAMAESVSGMKDSVNRDMLSFLTNMQNNFDAFSDRTHNVLRNMENDINESYSKSQEQVHQSSVLMHQQMQKISSAQDNLQNLSKDILSLQAILQDKKTRGTFGEIELYALLEAVYGNDAHRFERQFVLNNGSRVDALIKGFDGLSPICVDAKFPLENYRLSVDGSLSKEEREVYAKAFRKDLLKHIRDISEKYIIPSQTAPFAFLFLPAEAIYAEVYARYDDVVEQSYKAKVFIVSPTTLMAYLTAVKSIYLQQKRDASALNILKELDNLDVLFQNYQEKNAKLSRDFERLMEDYERENKIGLKIVQQFRKIYDIQEGNNNYENQ